MNERLKNLSTSVVVCTYNGSCYLQQQLDSILNQSQPVDEIIIQDDNSLDCTLQILEEYTSHYPGLIKVHVNRTNLGTIGNLESAIAKCSGEIIFLSDQDDIWHPEKVSRMVSFFQKKPDTLLLFTNGNLINERNEALHSTLWDKWNFPPELQKKWKNNKEAFQQLIINHNKVTGATVALRRILLEIALPIDAPEGYWHDAWFALHAAAQNGLRFIPESLIDYRIHAEQQVGITIRTALPLRSDKPAMDHESFVARMTSQYPKMAIRRGILGRIMSIMRYSKI